MKPNFALDFRNDAITLLHRTARGWQVVGQTAVDTPDLAEALSFMRATALGLSPSGMTTKLVIPNSQVLYTRVTAPATDAGRRRKQVARALEGATPYAVADLVFDTTGTRPDLEVAVIARETLAEAEAFATAHRFNPVSFVAVPDHASFATEPWFGPTSCAAEFLAEGQRVERDAVPLALFNREPLVGQEELFVQPQSSDASAVTARAGEIAILAPSDDAEVADAPIALSPAGPDPVEAAGELPDRRMDMPEAAVPAPVTDEPVLHDGMAADAPLADPVAVGPVSVETDLPHTPDLPPAQHAMTALPPDDVDPQDDDLALEPEEFLAHSMAEDRAPEPAAQPPARHDDPVADLALAAAAPAPDRWIEPERTEASFTADEAPMALDVVDDLPEPTGAPKTPSATASVLDTSIDDDVPATPPAAIMVAFGSRRALEASAKEAAARSGAVKPAAGKSGPARSSMANPQGLPGGTAPRSGATAKVTMLPPRADLPTAPSATGRLPQRGATAFAGSQTGVAKAGSRAAAKPGAAGKALRGLGALVTAPSIAGGEERRAIVQTITPPTGPSSAASAAAASLLAAKTKPASSGFGTRGVSRAKPRYLGLILTGILLVFLALVAAWSTLFLESRDTGTPDPAAVVEAVPTPEDEMLADLQDPNAAPPGPTAEALPDAAVVEAATPEPAAVPEPAPISGFQTETAAAPAPASDPQDEIFLAAMDAPPAMQDALSLPDPAERVDASPAQPAPPPPFGTLYTFDADGLIVATPQGVLTPEGVAVFAGRPKLEPPARPANLAPAVAAATSPSAPPTENAGAVDLPAADPALAAARPRPRPEGLTPPTQNADDDASLAPAEDSRFASLRPRPKPATLIAAAAVFDPAAVAPVNPPTNPVAALGAQGASLTAQANATAAVQGSAPSPLALAVSRKPEARPQDLSRAVEAAAAVASRQPSVTAPTEEAAVAEDPKDKTELEADSEPEVATAMPRLPTKTTVAKQATYVNAINLSKVNLIGVYGTQSDRYALIRQTNGRYKKVKVGDSFDGGRVAAITTSEVRYQKSGKMVTLALPKS